MNLRKSCMWLMLLLLLFLSACGEQRTESTISDVNANTNIVLEIVEDTLSPSGVVIKMTNYTDENLWYGEDFTLVEWIDEKWYVVPYKDDENYGFPAIGYTLAAKQSEEMNIAWDYAYGELSPGTYQLIKSFSEEGSTQNYNSAVEFSIE